MNDFHKNKLKVGDYIKYYMRHYGSNRLASHVAMRDNLFDYCTLYVSPITRISDSIYGIEVECPYRPHETLTFGSNEVIKATMEEIVAYKLEN